MEFKKLREKKSIYIFGAIAEHPSNDNIGGKGMGLFKC